MRGRGEIKESDIYESTTLHKFLIILELVYSIKYILKNLRGCCFKHQGMMEFYC